jgi:WD40 repeat protein
MPGVLLRVFGGTLVALALLTACSNMFKTEEQVEADRITLEISRAQVPGSSGAAFTADGNLVAIGTREMIWVADAATRQTLARISYQKAARFGGRKSLLFIDDHRLLIGAVGAIYLWDMQERSVTDRFRLRNSLQSPRAIAWSGATQTLAYSSGSTMEPVTLVRVGSDGFGASRSLVGFEGVPADLLFSRNGEYLAATGDEHGVLVRKVDTDEPVGELPTTGVVDNLELFGENKLLVSGADIAVWTFLREEEALELEDPNLQGQVTGQVAARVAGTLAVGSLFAVGLVACTFGACDSSLFYLPQAAYSVATSPVQASPQPWCGRSTSVSPDGKWLADIYPGITREVIRIFDVESGELVKTLNPRGEYHCIAKFSPNSQQLLITSSKAATLYSTETWQHHDIRLE